MCFGTEIEWERERLNERERYEDERQKFWVLKDIIRPVSFMVKLKVKNRADLAAATKKQHYLFS